MVYENYTYKVLNTTYSTEYNIFVCITRYTVFYGIQAPVRTPKLPEGCVYSGLIDLILCGYFRHIPNFTDVRFKRANQNWFP